MSADEETSIRHEVIVDPTYGYRRLEPMPSESQLTCFYQSDYYDLLLKGGRAPELRRLLAGGQEAERERDWLRETLYDDITTELLAHGAGPRVLDVGCGQGELLQWLGEHGFDAQGIEPSDDAAGLARERGLDARTATLEELVQQQPAPTYQAVLLLNVLEHVPNAPQFLRETRRLLEPDGLLYIRVPNDFNPLQLAAKRKLGVDPWWIAIPDHVNYFDVNSLCALNRELGFEPVDVQADFPMELFLLMGLNYVGRPDVGATCHAYRVEAERSMPAEIRRNLFRSFAACGIGRDSRVLFKRVETQASKQQLAGPGDRRLSVERHGYQYLPLRRADIQTLRLFRNDQVEVLRQTEPISSEQQERWFDDLVLPTQRDPRPPMMLVSILDSNGQFIGYGGLTNIDWTSSRAEVSFLVDPVRAADPHVYRRDMVAFLEFLADWAFDNLGLNRLFTETYAFRDLHIETLEQLGFSVEGRLREHVSAGGRPTDSILHGLLANDWHTQ